LKTSRAAIVVGNILSVISGLAGGFLGLIALVGFIIEITSPTVGGLIIAFFFTTLSFIFIRAGVLTGRRIVRFKGYVSLISTDGMTSIQQIATHSSQPVDFVRADLQKMINKKYFVDAYIDDQTDSIRIGSTLVQAAPIQPPSLNQSAPPAVQAELEIFNCSACGASGTKPKGTLTRCEYCGSPIA